MWEGQAHPHDTKFHNCRAKIKDSRAFPSWSLIHGSSWSGLIKAEPGWLGPKCARNKTTCNRAIYGVPFVSLMFYPIRNIKYRKTSSISRTKFQNLNVSCILLQLSSLNPLKPGVKLRMKERLSTLFQLHLNYQQLYCLLRCDLY